MSVCGGIEVEAAEAVAEAAEAATVVTNVTEANGKKKQLKPCRKQMANCFFIFLTIFYGNRSTEAAYLEAAELLLRLKLSLPAPHTTANFVNYSLLACLPASKSL